VDPKGGCDEPSITLGIQILKLLLPFEHRGTKMVQVLGFGVNVR
jgi:hypothetical protein